jgi:hypothetical protein
MRRWRGLPEKAHFLGRLWSKAETIQLPEAIES